MAKPPEEIHEAHPEIYHYTTHHGLRGIFQSGSLWATHYRYLNDANEVMQFKTHFVDRLTPHVEAVIRRHCKKSFKSKRHVQKGGGIRKVAARDAANLVNSFYKVTYEGGGNDKPPYADPYIASFCSHEHEDACVRANGLLSQWRAYGPGGGVAIVFDTRKLCSLLYEEGNKYHVALGHFSDVVYDDDSKLMETEFDEFFSLLPTLYPAFIGESGTSVDEFLRVRPETL